MSRSPARDSCLYTPDAIAVGILLFGKRRCCHCRAQLPKNADYFGRDKTQPIGLTSNCRRCRRQLSKQYHETHGRQRRAERGRAAIT